MEIRSVANIDMLPLRRPSVGASREQLDQYKVLVQSLARDEIYYLMTGDDKPYGNPNDPNQRREGIDAQIGEAIKAGFYRDPQGKKSKLPSLMNYDAPSDEAIRLSKQRIERMTQNRDQ